jgi:Pentapeptide repeats (8 copies)
LRAEILRASRADFRAWSTHGLALGVLLLALAGFSHPTILQSGTARALPPKESPVLVSPTPSTVLQNEKLVQQIRQLEISNENASSPWRYVIALAPTLAALAAILTFGLGWSTQRSESRRQKDQDRALRESESIREFDSRFTAVVTNLGSNSISLQASAASTLPIFLSPRYVGFRSHIIRVAIANLRLSGDKVILNLLVDVLGAALRLEYAPDDQETSTETVDLADTYLRSLNIVGVSMRERFAADRADLTHGRMDHSDLWKSEFREALLIGASLRQANLGQARFDGANLSHAILRGCRATSASLRGIDGRFAMLQGASLQSAHFEDADLRGARFDGANLADCYFLRTKLDEGALQSILRSQRWRSAHFDRDIYDQLLAGLSSS